jgi:hypothetical protein
MKMRHEDMCDDNYTCSRCNPGYRMKEAAKLAESKVKEENQKEARAECEAKWKQNSDSLRCDLCEATADIPRPIRNPQLLKPSTWFTKEITVTEKSEEHGTYLKAKQITICHPCMMTPWDIQTPTDWQKSIIRMETLATGADRVWRRKTKNNIKNYLLDIEERIDATESEGIKRRLSPFRNRTNTIIEIEERKEKKLKRLNQLKFT